MSKTIYLLSFSFAYEDTVALRAYDSEELAEKICDRLQRRLLKKRSYTQDEFVVYPIKLSSKGASL